MLSEGKQPVRLVGQQWKEWSRGKSKQGTPSWCTWECPNAPPLDLSFQEVAIQVVDHHFNRIEQSWYAPLAILMAGRAVWEHSRQKVCSKQEVEVICPRSPTTFHSTLRIWISQILVQHLNYYTMLVTWYSTRTGFLFLWWKSHIMVLGHDQFTIHLT